MSNSKLISIATLLLLSSCGGYEYKRSETVEEKIARYQASNLVPNHVPEIAVLNDQKLYQATGRGPASLGMAIHPDKNLAPFSNKRIYFLSMLSQYKTLKRFSTGSSSPDLSVCPSFHTEILDQDGYKETKHSQALPINFNTQQVVNNQTLAAHYPELFLPMTIDAPRPRVVDLIRKEQDPANVKKVLQKALEIHLTKTYNELKELCEYGSSDNYYIYENLITHINDNKFQPGHESFQTLMKTTVWSNMAIIQSLTRNKRGRSIASTGPKNNYAKEVIYRMKAGWTQNYFSRVYKK